MTAPCPAVPIRSARWLVVLVDPSGKPHRYDYPWDARSTPRRYEAFQQAAAFVRGMLQEHPDWTACGLFAERWSPTLDCWVQVTEAA